MKKIICSLMMVSLFAFGGCSWVDSHSSKQVASTVDYLYPNAKEAPQMKSEVTYLRPPVRVGIAFVPSANWGDGLSEVDKLKLQERVKAAFTQYPFVGSIELIPSTYLQRQGGFGNLEQVARMFNVEVMVLLSYDQVQFNDKNSLALLYWTIVGAYIIHGDQYDVQTLVDASVFDVHTHKLLFRAPGVSQVKGGASMAGLGERARAAQTEGYDKAVDDLIPQLQAELDKFKERIKSDAGFKIENKPGYSGGGGLNWVEVVLAGLLIVAAYATRRSA
ncbi:rhombotarget lipoprotein [Pseudomonas sp.]|jgi:rhombotail lipoprotein|uniref:rhombotarget lipoprotein n=1 Tax=Pseudomonas sp. TaxID=306 RepID=UPI00263909F1|nr:rhombotarget lipoprotein [Pseudomonas sp.]